MSSGAIVTDLALALDPVAMCRLAGTEPDPWQAEALRCGKRKLILLCGRQTGKSTVTSYKALHTALYLAPALVLVMARRVQQATELFRKIRTAYDSLERALPVVCPVLNSSERRLEFANGSRIQVVASNADDIRGFSPGLVIVDEAAFVADSAYETLRPMLAVSQGQLILLSTAGGRQGFFFEDFENGPPEEWHKVRVLATECPRITAGFLASERTRLGERRYNMEYMCEWGDLSTAAFAFDDIAAMFGEGAEDWEGGGHELVGL